MQTLCIMSDAFSWSTILTLHKVRARQPYDVHSALTAKTRIECRR